MKGAGEIWETLEILQNVEDIMQINFVFYLARRAVFHRILVGRSTANLLCVGWLRDKVSVTARFLDELMKRQDRNETWLQVSGVRGSFTCVASGMRF